MNKRGISEVVTTVIMITMVLLASVLLWTIVNNLLQGKIKSSEACFGNVEKVTLDKRNICYDLSTPKVRFAISLGDVDVQEVLVSISGDAGTESFKITNADSAIENLAYLGGSTPVKLPPKNGGKTYEYLWDFKYNPTAGKFTNLVNSIKIAPIIDGTQCDISDTSAEIDDCILLA